MKHYASKHNTDGWLSLDTEAAPLTCLCYHCTVGHLGIQKQLQKVIHILIRVRSTPPHYLQKEGNCNSKR